MLVFIIEIIHFFCFPEECFFMGGLEGQSSNYSLIRLQPS